MIDSLTFGLVLTILVAWVVSWALIGAVVSVSKGFDPVGGLVQGMTMGPIGVMFIVISQKPKTVSKSSGDYKSEQSKSVTDSRKDLYK
jgi:hypothetical protein